MVTDIAIIFYRIRVNQYKVSHQRLEERVTLKTKDLIQKNETLQNIDSVITRLISIISHDIVTTHKFINQ